MTEQSHSLLPVLLMALTTTKVCAGLRYKLEQIGRCYQLDQSTDRAHVSVAELCPYVFAGKHYNHGRLLILVVFILVHPDITDKEAAMFTVVQYLLANHQEDMMDAGSIKRWIQLLTRTATAIT